MIKNIEQTIRQYLPQVIHMSLATCRDNKPWVCEVHFVYDEQLNMYFRSRLSTRHSKEIADNPRVAGNMVVQHQVEDRPRAVYFEGTAELLENVNQEDIAYTLYCDRFNTDASILEEAQTEGGHKFYKISVETFYLFDSRETSSSRKYKLVWN